MPYRVLSVIKDKCHNNAHHTILYYSTRAIHSQRRHWARCYHPMAMMLGMTASSHVDGRYVNKRSCLLAVMKEVGKRVDSLALTSRW